MSDILAAIYSVYIGVYIYLLYGIAQQTVLFHREASSKKFILHGIHFYIENYV